MEVAYAYWSQRRGNWSLYRYSPRVPGSERMLITVDQLPRFRYERANTGIFCSAYRYDQPDLDQASLYGDFYLDFDDDQLDKQRFTAMRQIILAVCQYIFSTWKLLPEDLQIWFSGSKGFHLIIPAVCLGIQPHPQLHRLFQTMANAVAAAVPNEFLDLRIYDRKRQFRLPHSRHQATGLYKIPLDYDEFQQISWSHLRHQAQSPRPMRPATPVQRSPWVFGALLRAWRRPPKPPRLDIPQAPRDLTDSPPCMQGLLAGQWSEGQRNNLIMTLASYLRQQGWRAQQAADYLLAWSAQHLDPPLPEREIENVVGSVYRNHVAVGCLATRDLLERLGHLELCKPGQCPIYLRMPNKPFRISTQTQS